MTNCMPSVILLSLTYCVYVSQLIRKPKTFLHIMIFKRGRVLTNKLMLQRFDSNVEHQHLANHMGIIMTVLLS